MQTILTSTRFQAFYLIAVLVLISSCSGSSAQKPPGGPCTYKSFPGTAVFTELKPVTNGVEVLFDFTLSDPTAPVNCEICFKNGEDFHLQRDSSLPAADWLVSNGITVGVEVPAVYQEMQSGSCNPYGIIFPTIPNAYGY